MTYQRPARQARAGGHQMLARWPIRRPVNATIVMKSLPPLNVPRQRMSTMMVLRNKIVQLKRFDPQKRVTASRMRKPRWTRCVWGRNRWSQVLRNQRGAFLRSSRWISQRQTPVPSCAAVRRQNSAHWISRLRAQRHSKALTASPRSIVTGGRPDQSKAWATRGPWGCPPGGPAHGSGGFETGSTGLGSAAVRLNAPAGGRACWPIEWSGDS